METLFMGKSRTVIGLDQALTNTGYCVLKENKVIAKGVIKTSDKNGDYLERLIYIEKEVYKLLTKYKPNHIFYEDVFSVGKGAWKKLGDVKIMLELLFKKNNIEATCLSPLVRRNNSWRRLNGLNTSDKKIWQKQCGESNEHIADAYGIAKAGIILIEKSSHGN